MEYIAFIPFTYLIVGVIVGYFVTDTMFDSMQADVKKGKTHSMFAHKPTFFIAITLFWFILFLMFMARLFQHFKYKN